MSIEKAIHITEIQRFCMHDGPGIRTTVFLKGCPLRCQWCHNPETQKQNREILFYANKCVGCGACSSACPASAHTIDKVHHINRKDCCRCGACVEGCPTGALELCGKAMSAEDIILAVEKDAAFYGDNGGITLSGGEPFMQGEATLALLKQCKKKRLHVVVETCGFADPHIIRQAVPYVDLFLWDIKDTCEERHKTYTGVSREIILQNLAIANEMKANIRLRCILVNNVNTNKAHYEAVAKLASTLDCCEGVEWIPYHAYGGTKSVFLGGEDTGRKEWIPTETQIAEAKRMLEAYNIQVL